MFKDVIGDLDDIKDGVKEGLNEIKNLPDEIIWFDEIDKLPDEVNLDDGGNFTDKECGNLGEELKNLPDEIIGEKGEELEKFKMWTSKIEVPFTCRERYDAKEYKRQLAGQEKGMNKLSVCKFLENREKFRNEGRDLRISSEMQKKMRQEARADRVYENRKNGMSRMEAEKEADKWLESKAVLHDPDQIAGGNATDVTGLGDKEINSSIGAQWKNGRIDIVEEKVRQYVEENNLTEDELKHTYLNMKLVLEEEKK